jgi:uncharacterized membrane protein YkvA (DUF1232 family)
MPDSSSAEYLSRVAAAMTPADEPGILTRAARKNSRSAARSGGLVGRVGLLLDMMRDREFHFSWASRAVILAGLAYFLMPADAIPDMIPFFGFIDDAAVIGAVFRRLSREVERYREHLSAG